MWPVPGLPDGWVRSSGSAAGAVATCFGFCFVMTAGCAVRTVAEGGQVVAIFDRQGWGASATGTMPVVVTMPETLSVALAAVSLLVPWLRRGGSRIVTVW